MSVSKAKVSKKEISVFCLSLNIDSFFFLKESELPLRSAAINNKE